MRRRGKRSRGKELLPYPVIKAASEGNAEAMAKVLKHYESYIKALSARKLYDEHGEVVFVVDETLRQRLEAKLIAKVLEFEPE